MCYSFQQNTGDGRAWVYKDWWLTWDK